LGVSSGFGPFGLAPSDVENITTLQEGLSPHQVAGRYVPSRPGE